MKAFLEETNVFLDSLTDYFHLVNTSRTALQMLTDQVRRIVDAGADDAVVAALFPLAEKTTGQNLRAYTLRDESAKDSHLAEMWLFAIFARYEAWAGAVETEYGINNAARGCQFPGPSARGDFQSVFGNMRTSAELFAIFGATRTNPGYIQSDANVIEALHVYRYYKEVRNSLIHSGGDVHDRLIESAARAKDACDVLKEQGELIGEITILTPSGNRFDNLDFQFVRSAIWIIQRLAATIDLKILLSTSGEQIFIDKWKSIHGHTPASPSLRQRSSRPWFMHWVSADLSVPLPPDSQGKHWPKAAREGFVTFGIDHGLIRR